MREIIIEVMPDESKPLLTVIGLLFLPVIIALGASSLGLDKLSASSGQFAIGVWCVINTICSVTAAWKLIGPLDNVAARVALTAFLGLLFWLLSAALAFFGGCVCALAVRS